MRNQLTRIWESTLWAQSLQVTDLKYRHSKLIYIPLFYVLVIYSGHAAAVYGVPTIQLLFPWPLATLAATLFSLSGVICFVGNVIPKLWRFEVIGASTMLGLLVAYAAALLLRAIVGNDEASHSFVGLLALAALWVPLMRIDVLGTERRIREAKALLAQKAAE